MDLRMIVLSKVLRKPFAFSCPRLLFSKRADPGCGDFDRAGFPMANPTVRRSRILTE
jgi:hypothetical protein